MKANRIIEQSTQPSRGNATSAAAKKQTQFIQNFLHKGANRSDFHPIERADKVVVGRWWLETGGHNRIQIKAQSLVGPNRNKLGTVATVAAHAQLIADTLARKEAVLADIVTTF